MSTRSRLISTVAYTPATDPPTALILTQGHEATPQYAQAARRHPFSGGNQGPVAITRIQTPEGHPGGGQPAVIAYLNPDFTHEAPQPPAEALPPRLRPYTPADPPPTPVLLALHETRVASQLHVHDGIKVWDTLAIAEYLASIDKPKGKWR